jgi:di/tricarboxylate transporter
VLLPFLHAIGVCGLVVSSSFFLELDVGGWCVWISLIVGVDRIWAGYDPGFMFILLLGLWVLADIIDIETALVGFSNSSLATIVVLFWISKLIERMAILKFLFVPILGHSKRLSIVLGRLLPLTAFFSAFVNNTPIVLMLIPVLEWWTIQQRISLARVLMPVSFASMIGGMCTLIGTSTNLIVQQQISLLDPGAEFGFFEPAYAGFPISIVGLGYLIFFAHFLLPSQTFQRHYLPRYYAVFKYAPRSKNTPQHYRSKKYNIHRQIKNFMRSYPGVCWVKTLYQSTEAYVVVIGILQQLEHFSRDGKQWGIRSLSPAQIKALLLTQSYFEVHLNQNKDFTRALKKGELTSLSIFVVNRKGKILQDVKCDYVHSEFNPSATTPHDAQRIKSSQDAPSKEPISVSEEPISVSEEPISVSKEPTSVSKEFLLLPAKSSLLPTEDVSSSMEQTTKTIYNLFVPETFEKGDILTLEADYSIYKGLSIFFSHIREVPLFESSQEQEDINTWIGYFLRHVWTWCQARTRGWMQKVLSDKRWERRCEKVAMSVIILIGFGILSTLAVLQIAPLAAMALVFFLVLVVIDFPTLNKVPAWKFTLIESNWSLFIILASSIGIGQGLIVSGVSREIATRISSIFIDLGLYPTLIGLFSLTAIMTSFVSNAAVVSFMIPIAYDISIETGFESKALYLCIMMATSSAFLTNIGYQTNLIVQESTGYRARDFLKFGIGMTFLSLVITTAMCMLIYTI